MIESYSVPPHFSHFLDVSWLWTCFASLVPKSLKNWLPHFLHFSKHLFPWSSASLSGLNPDRMWRPSIFCDTRYLRYPASSRVTKLMCVNDGIALPMWTMFLLGLSPTFWAFFSQAPGPVLRTVLTPDLKSGMPHAVLIPAPVKAMKCLLSKIRWASLSIFFSRTSSGSKNSFF